jgi:predicted secreted hydrolase
VKSGSWADHQWGDFVISGTGGWDWFSIQLDNNTELMLYVLRDRAGAASALFGSFIMPDGTEQQLVLTVTPQLQDRELYFPGAVFAGPTYWEGAVDVHGSGAGSPTGVGYVELTGYAPPGPSSQ